MTWEELMGMTSTTGYDIWSEDVSETKTYSTSTNGGRHLKPQSNYPISTNGGRHFKPQSNNQAPTYGGDTSNPNQVTQHPQMGRDTLNPKIPILMNQQKFPTSQGGRHFKPPHLETDNPVEALNKSTQQTPAEEDEVLKQLQKTQANISL